MSDQKQQIDVLMYHSISEAAGPTSIPPAIFEGQMNALAAAGYHVADFADMIAWRAGDHPLPEKTAIITFDDGFYRFSKRRLAHSAQIEFSGHRFFCRRSASATMKTGMALITRRGRS